MRLFSIHHLLPTQRDLDYFKKQQNATYSIHFENVHLFQFEFVEIENKKINNCCELWYLLGKFY